MNNLIAVWGKNGSGKSTVASNLACCLAKRGCSTAIIGANRFYGALQYMFGVELSEEQSIRNVLTGRNEMGIEPYFREYGLVKGLFIASLSNADDCIGYQKFSADKATRFLNLAKNHFHYTIVDCDESTEDPLSMLALTLADKVIYVTKPNIQHAVFASAYENLVAGLQITDKMEVLFNCNKGVADVDSYQPFHKAGRHSVLPFCKAFELTENLGKPFMTLKSVGRTAKKYKTSMEAIAAMLYNELNENESGEVDHAYES